MINRRNFFSALAVVLAHVPVLGAWIHRQLEDADDLRAMREAIADDRVWNGWADENLSQEIDETCRMSRIIRWIPVSERLPTTQILSPGILIVSGGVVFAGQAWWKSDTEIIWEDIHQRRFKSETITHWAELPSPPESANLRSEST